MPFGGVVAAVARAGGRAVVRAAPHPAGGFLCRRIGVSALVAACGGPIVVEATVPARIGRRKAPIERGWIIRFAVGIARTIRRTVRISVAGTPARTLLITVAIVCASLTCIARARTAVGIAFTAISAVAAHVAGAFGLAIRITRAALLAPRIGVARAPRVVALLADTRAATRGVDAKVRIATAGAIDARAVPIEALVFGGACSIGGRHLPTRTAAAA